MSNQFTYSDPLPGDHPHQEGHQEAENYKKACGGLGALEEIH